MDQMNIFEGYLETISEFCREVAGSVIMGLQAKYELVKGVWFVFLKGGNKQDG